DGSLQEYQFLSTYGFGSYIVNGTEVKTLGEYRIPNTRSTLEIANNTNLVFEGQFLQGNVFFEFDLFYNKITNILRRKNASIPQITGLTLPAENIGEVENKGFDLNLGYRGNLGPVTFSASINGGYAKNKILYWDEAPGAPEWQMSTGRPMNTGLVYQYDGVFATQEDIASEAIDYSAITNNLRPGDMKYKDIGGRDEDGNLVMVPDGKITPEDRVRMDNNDIPTFQGGLNLNLAYKNFDLSVLFQGASGARVYVSAGESGNIGNYLL